MKFSSKVKKCALSPMRKFHPYAVAAKEAGKKNLQRLAAPGGDKDVALREVHPQVAVVLLDGLDEYRHPRRFRVSQYRQLEIPEDDRPTNLKVVA